MMGFFSRIFASANAASHTTVDDAEVAKQAQIKKIEALLDSVNSASQHVRNYYITFLLACFYIALIVWSTTDLMLLKNTPVTMPLLNVNLPITGFYTFAPYFFLLLHFNLLLQFSLLADKVHRFDQAVIELPDSDSHRYYYTRLFAFVFTQILSARHHSGLLRFLLTLMVWITAIWLPLGILIGLQVGFLPYHDENILFWQRSAIMLDLLVLLIFWPVIRAPDSRWRSWIKQASGLSWLLKLKATMRPVPALPHESINRNSGFPVLEGGVSLLTGFCVILFVWGIAVLPDSVHEKNMRDWLKAYAWSDAWQSFCPSKETKEPYFIATEWLFDGRYEPKQQQEAKAEIEKKQCGQRTKAGMLHRNLILRDTLLIANELKAEDVEDLKSDDDAKHESALKKVTGLVLSGRDFRYADFSRSQMPKANFVGADPNFNNPDKKPSDLSYADLSLTTLTGANVSMTILIGADLTASRLQEAYFAFAKLQRAKLQGAELRGTTLDGANLQRADMEYANLQGAKLRSAQLQGAYLRYVELQGADLNQAKLQGANLSFAKLWGANFSNRDFIEPEKSCSEKSYPVSVTTHKDDGLKSFSKEYWFYHEAELKGASFYFAELQGANLKNVNLKGADLRYAKLQGALLDGMCVSLSDISHSEFGVLKDDDLQESIQEVTESVSDQLLREKIINVLTDRSQKNREVFPLSDKAENPSRVFEVTGEDIWYDEGSLKGTRLQGFWDKLHVAQNSSEYQNKLGSYLIEMACSDRWIAEGIIRNRLNWDDRDYSSVAAGFSRIAGSIAQCLLSLKDQQNEADQWICPAVREINQETLKILQEIAAKKNPNETITPTFSCRTERSDLASAAE